MIRTDFNEILDLDNNTCNYSYLAKKEENPMMTCKKGRYDISNALKEFQIFLIIKPDDDNYIRILAETK